MIIPFYYQARGSVSEVQDFLILSKDLGYIDFEICRRLGLRAHEARRLINGLIGSAEKQNKSNE